MQPARLGIGWRWLVAGAVAALLMEAVMFALRLALGVPALPELVQDQVLAVLPGALFGLFIDQLQFSGKPLLLVGLATCQLVAGTLLGWLCGRWWGRPGPVGGVLLGLLLWLLLEALVAAWGDGPEAAVRAAGPLLASALVYGLSLVWAAGLLSAGPERAAVDHRRRVVVLGGSAGGALLVVGGALARISAAMGEQATMLARAKPGGDGSALATPPDHLSAALPTPASAQPIATEPTAVPNSAPAPFVAPPGVADEITPNERFYIVSKNLVDPRVQAENWSLEVFGLVKEPRSFSYQEVLALPSTSAYITLECISNPLGGKLMSNALWTGVPLAHLLGLVGVHVDARAVVFRSADNYYESFPLEVALAPTTLLAHAMNGVPLTEKHGFPLRVVLPGRYGMKQPKWVTKIELTADPIDGYWVRRGWDREALPQTVARIDTPSDGSTLAGSQVPVGGVAFAGTRGISRVEVSTDGGATWRPAQTRPPLAPATWVQWGLTWEDAAPGTYLALARATDGEGALQPAEEAGSFPRGATGYHHARITVQERS